MYSDRIELYRNLESSLDTKILVYVTGDRQNLGAQIAPDAIDFFISQLDKIGVTKRISLFLYTIGGDTAAAWNIVNLLRMFCDTSQVIIPYKAHSAGTIISLGADELVMTKQATLSPIDPSINTPLNPLVPMPNAGTLPVSVEAIKGYLEFAKQELNICDSQSLANIFIKLTEYVHPLVLGQAYRSRAQIKMLAEKLLNDKYGSDTEKMNKVIAFLCSDSGSHDYTINRREAANDLKLTIKKPTNEQYALIKQIYDDISDELKLTQPFDWNRAEGEISIRRVIIESIPGGSDYLVWEGRCVKEKSSNGQLMTIPQVLYEGWRHEDICYTKAEYSIEDEGGMSYECVADDE